MVQISRAKRKKLHPPTSWGYIEAALCHMLGIELIEQKVNTQNVGSRKIIIQTNIYVKSKKILE